MKTTHAMALATLALAPVLPTTSAATTAEITDDDRSGAVAVAEVSRRGDVVVGTLVNRGGDQIRDIRLLIDIPFLWKNELAPGDDSPGRSSVLTVAGPIAPNGRLAFEFTPTPPLPERTDGRYADPKVSVMGYESVAVR